MPTPDTIPEPALSILRGRFLSRLEQVAKDRVGGPSPLRLLVDAALPAIASDRALLDLDTSVGGWDREKVHRDRALAGNRRLRRALMAWEKEHRLAVPWVREVAIFSLMFIVRDVGRQWWRIPPRALLGETGNFNISVERWMPEFESQAVWHQRQMSAAAAVLKAHAGRLVADEPERAARRRHPRLEDRNLEWLALRRVYEWGYAKIAAAYTPLGHVQNADAQRHNVRDHVERWGRFIGLPVRREASRRSPDHG